jgi:hypothetical protein
VIPKTTMNDRTGEKMAALCAEFGICRKGGYEIFDGYKDCGVVSSG